MAPAVGSVLPAAAAAAVMDQGYAEHLDDSLGDPGMQPGILIRKCCSSTDL